MHDINRLDKKSYDAACAFVFSRPFQLIMTGTAMEARSLQGAAVPAVLAGIRAHASTDPAWSDVAGFIDLTFGLDQVDRDLPHAASAEKYLGSLAGRTAEYESLSREMISSASGALAIADVSVPVLRFRPSVFDYLGPCDGYYWKADGERIACSRSEALRLARNDDLDLVEIDRAAGRSGYTGNWREFLVNSENAEISGPEAPAP